LIIVKLFVCFVQEKVHIFLIVWWVHDYCRVAFVGWKHNVCVLVQILEDQSLLSSDVAGGLALEKILVICLRILSVCSDGSVDDWLYLADNLWLWNQGAIAKLGPLASADIVSWDKSLLDRFLMLSGQNYGFLWGTMYLCIFIFLSEDCVYVFMACLYIRSRICQISCRNVTEQVKGFLWKIWTICNFMKLMRSLMKKADFTKNFWICKFLGGSWVVGTSRWCYYPYSVLGMPSDSFLVGKNLSLLKVFTLASIFFPRRSLW